MAIFAGNKVRYIELPEGVDQMLENHWKMQQAVCVVCLALYGNSKTLTPEYRKLKEAKRYVGKPSRHAESSTSVNMQDEGNIPS